MVGSAFKNDQFGSCIENGFERGKNGVERPVWKLFYKSRAWRTRVIVTVGDRWMGLRNN